MALIAGDGDAQDRIATLHQCLRTWASRRRKIATSQKIIVVLRTKSWSDRRCSSGRVEFMV
jgi:hypothetical protein